MINRSPIVPIYYQFDIDGQPTTPEASKALKAFHSAVDEKAALIARYDAHSDDPLFVPGQAEFCTPDPVDPRRGGVWSDPEV